MLRSPSCRGRARLARIVVVAAIALAGAGCSTVEYYEKELLSDPPMVFETDPTEAHFHQKCLYSMEGSAGGIGDSAGGGCGCY